ncbi:vWA domain-containing protein [Lunatibacter salilacus]|uniref:vWA domain-containing protein n=1 Tax=Lunatibacter salilacus TaxID=2483804 RepID=UPI00131A9A43|nr:VWA domain-containing protein [Lunatibacter salilacus]
MKSLFSSLATLFLLFNLSAQEQPSPILFIYDASGSMWGQMENKTKKAIASEVLGVTVSKLPNNQNIGLIAYGHRNLGDCDDIEFMVGLANSSKGTITNAVNGLNPTGKTPLARSAILAINSLLETNTKATIILITDGIESCDGDICQVVTDAKAEGIDFKLHIVGFGLKEGEKEQLICAANAGNGNYYDAGDSAGLGDVLTEATNATVDKPNGNFSVYAVKNGEPVDAWVKPQNSITGEELKGARTYRDTAWVYLPSGKYDIEIRPLENSDIPGTTISIEMKEGEAGHQDIYFDGGILEVTTTNNGDPWDAMVKMYDKETGKVISNVRTYARPKQMEVAAGSYKVSYLALNLEGISINAEVNDVEVKAITTTSISHEFKSGIALIGVETKSGELIDAAVNFRETSTGKAVAGSRTYTSESSNPRKFVLNPGVYEVTIVTLGHHKGNTSKLSVTIEEGKTVEKIISF